MAEIKKQPTSRSIIPQKQTSPCAQSLIETSLVPWDTISPEGRITGMNESSRKVFAKDFVTESRRVRKDGSRFTLRIDVTHRCDASGKSISICGT